MVILHNVSKVKLTKYHTCAAENPGEDGEYTKPWTWLSTTVDLEPYMLRAYLKKSKAAQKLHRITLLNLRLATFDFHFQKIKNVCIFMIFEPSGNVHDSRNHYSRLWANQITRKNSRRNTKSFKEILCWEMSGTV